MDLYGKYISTPPEEWWIVDIEQIATHFFSRSGIGVKIMPLSEIFLWPPPFHWRTTDQLGPTRQTQTD